MTKRIDIDARISWVRLEDQSSDPSADSSGTYSRLYVKETGTSHGGLFLIKGTGEVFGPFITGTSAVGGGGGGGDLLLYDDSVFQITGTAISFDDGLDVATTGSVAFVASSNAVTVSWETGTTTAGPTSNRTTGGAYERQTMQFTIYQPLSISTIKWDLYATGTYSMYLSAGGNDVTVQSVISSEDVYATGVYDFTPDDVYLVLFPNTYYLTLKRTTANYNWNDVDAGSQSNELYYSPGIFYDGTWFDQYTAPVQFIAYKGLMDIPFP